MPDAVQNAFLILLGQIAIIATSIFFGVPYFLTSPSAGKVTLGNETTFYLIFIFFACSMMIANILIGWSAARASAKTVHRYTTKMFIIDLLIILVFFAMNNVIMFSFGDTLSMQSAKTINNIISSGIPLNRIAVTAAGLYALTSIFLILCKIWNYEYYKITQKVEFNLYEKMMWVVIAAFILLSGLAIYFSDCLMMQVICFLSWLCLWVYINLHWLLFDKTASSP